MAASRPSLGRLILVPALITLAVTLIRLGIYFALRLVRAGAGPDGVGKALGWAGLAFVLNTALGFGSFALFKSPIVQLAVFTLTSCLAIAVARPGWPALWRVLLAYGLTARIPVLVVMFLSIFLAWDTHYAKPRPDFPPMGPGGIFFWTAVLPQLSIWIYLTVVAGMFFGALAVGIRRLVRRGPDEDVVGASASARA
jgi:hypothetical protein